MTDLEINGACAEAIRIQTVVHPIRGKIMRHWFWVGNIEQMYDPLHDDAQAMVLVKKFQLFISHWRGKWTVSTGIGGHDKTGAQYSDLNRAICECVAKLEKAKGNQ